MAGIEQPVRNVTAGIAKGACDCDTHDNDKCAFFARLARKKRGKKEG
jgi:hypothetical protein